MDLHQKIIQLLQEIKPGQSQMTNTAYDTAWVARLYELGEPMAEDALSWLRHHQLVDGSWGAEVPVYHHDRLICTLAATIALARRGLDGDKARIKRGLEALETHWPRLIEDPAGETIAFEMLAPTLISEARSLGLLNRANSLSENMTNVRETKLAQAPGGMISRFVTMAFSAEMAGHDGLHILDINNLQEANGSVSYSPSATAYFTLYVDRYNSMAMKYLHRIFIERGAPNVAPADIFESAWALWNLALIDLEFVNNEMRILYQRHLDFMEKAWEPGQGVGSAFNWTLNDGDDTSLVYEVLTHFDRPPDLETLMLYEEQERFRCFTLEANPSISTNIHALGALWQAGLELQHPSVQKILSFLEKHKTRHQFWIDKWHVSPFYPTAHAVIASIKYDNAFAEGAIKWILDNQNADGAWGYFTPTAEETAYCLQALAVWKRDGGVVPDEVFHRSAEWLATHMEPPYPPLWIGKCLYSPTLVVRSTILSALTLMEQVSS